MYLFTENHTPAHIVKVFPKASDLFKVYGINFCCKGHIELKEAFNEMELAGASILAELNDAYDDWITKGSKATNWDAKSLTDITNYIKEYYHTYVQEELLALGELVTRIYRVHGHTSPHLIEAEMHLIKEVTEVIPMIQEMDETYDRHISQAIVELKKGNEKMVQLLKSIRTVTNHFEPPLDACGSYRVTYARLLELEAKMIDYIHIENNILFERIT